MPGVRVELTYIDYESNVLPLNYPVTPTRIELAFSD